MRAHQDNARAWNQAAIAYKRALPQTIERLRNGHISMCDVELPLLRPLAAKANRAIHLQCAGGEDTISLLALGAREVIGIDISADMLAIANDLGTELGAPARWIESDVLDVPDELTATADLVYTGRGAIVWIHDLTAWARTIARLLAANGALYVFEGHPITYAFDVGASTLQLDPRFAGYFARNVQTSAGWSREYIGDVGDAPVAKHEIAWPVSDVIRELLAAGLSLEVFEEYPDAFWPEFPKVPDAERRKIPNTYALVMRKRA